MKTLFIFFFSFSLAISNFANTESTLKLVHVIFRHGDRTPDSLYPNDPYTEEDFYPYRIAHLTNKGKLTSYNLGTYLRRKYNNLLGDVYTPDILSAISSHLPRTKASLQAVLAGLYPPSEELIWEKNLLWEPIPYDYLPAKENILFSSVRICPNGLKLLNENYIKLDSDPIYQKYNYLYPFLLENSGLNDNFYNVARFVFSTLKSEEDLGMELPKWTKRVYPDILREISENGLKCHMMGDLKTLTPGFLISKIINNTYSTINGVNEAKNKKIYLYSGHDENVAAILYFLDNFIAHIPNYGAHIIIEVHKFSGIYFLKFLHNDYDNDLEPQPVSIPNCGIYCPLEVFVRLYAKQLDPSNSNDLCTG
ncbi:venom acid phosphatase Acph-1-like [Onthophagus taurus]|uniref:venom acid phosphatase Acph-1-like n=1 Tax=Onthophagus taurus TaxID=166361 RepID=UPI0039BE8B76